MKRFLCILLFVTTAVYSVQAQQEVFLKEKSGILKNQADNLMELHQVVIHFQSDAESHWAYDQAKYLLKSVDGSGKNYHVDLAKIYAAYTQIFYGLSNTYFLNTTSKKDENSLRGLKNTLITDYTINENDPDYDKLSQLELFSVYSLISYYKVRSMPKYPDMDDRFQKYFLQKNRVFDTHSAESAYRIISLENKKLYYMTVGSLIIDFYYANNPKASLSENEAYIEQLLNLSRKLQKTPSNKDAISTLSDQEYYNYIKVGAEVQHDLLAFLVEELKVLRNNSE